VSAAVVVTDDALRDLDDIHAYIALQDGLARVDQVLDGIQNSLAKLADFSLRGEVPQEFLGLGVRDFRQVHCKPYRMIYRVIESTVYVLVVADGRRDMQTLLQRRLLG
jgi:toxin ParE1/3/4